jgi:hypothetical protein
MKYDNVVIYAKTDPRLEKGKTEIVFNVDGVDIPTGIKAEEPVEAVRALAKKLGAQ